MPDRVIIENLAAVVVPMCARRVSGATGERKLTQPNRTNLLAFQRMGRRALLAAVLLTAGPLRAEDWPMLGRDKTRNPVSPEKGAPVEWDIKTGRNVKWRATLGWFAWADPVVADGLVWL